MDSILAILRLEKCYKPNRDYWMDKTRRTDGDGSDRTKDNSAASANLTGKPSVTTLEEITESSVPDLEVYIVNMFPTIDKSDYPRDPDAVNNRVNDVVYHDRTEFDEKIAGMVSDYVDLAKELIRIAAENAKDKDTIEKQISAILGKQTLSKNRGGERRTFDHLLDGRFKITKLVRIELSDDDHTDISGKVFDFSSDTIEYLIEQGMEDAAKLKIS
jgi:NTE family protein